ncbi:MAG: transposase family protein [Capnocytophaga sp.]|nr:transposase family protein [Capnocytophaga sp.]
MDIEDFRVQGKCLHKLRDVLLIGLFTFLSNGEDYEDRVIFAKNNYDFVKCAIKINSSLKNKLF